MIKQYSIDFKGVSTSIPPVEFHSPTKYDDPVDRSQFRPDSEQVRMFRMNGGGSNGTPVYDDGDTPTDLEVQIRSGKLDKAEISQLQLKRQEEVKENISSAKKEKAEKEAEKEAKARQEYLDKATGFKGSNQTETE